MSRFIEIHYEGKKMFIKADSVEGIADCGDYRAIYYRGGGGYRAEEGIEDLYWMICGEEPEEEEDGIRVGDEVTIKSWLGKFIVLNEGASQLCAIGETGTLLTCDKESCTKTGRHFDKMKDVAESLINAMKEWKGAEE